jgi:hypothetical protein
MSGKTVEESTSVDKLICRHCAASASRSDVSVPLSYVFATKQFETHPSWGATEIRIENKRRSHAVHFGSLIPFALSVRIHPGVSFYRSPDDFAIYLRLPQ